MTPESVASSWQSDDTEVSTWTKLHSSPILWGGLATALFYGVIPFSPVWRTEITRYFAGHWIEYVTTALSFVGLAILMKKLIRLSSESQAVRWSGWTGSEVMPLHNVVEVAKQVQRNVRSAPSGWQGTHIARRIRDVCGFVLGRRSAAGLEEHLRYLGELAAGDLHSSYSLVRTVTWAVPILGFLGTVVGITDAIANLTPEQLETSLSGVTAGLGTAFDTTALSLGWSMIIVFATFFIERKEQNIFGQIEEFGTRQLAVLFPDGSSGESTLAAAEAQAAEQLLKKTESFLNWQMLAWQESVEALRHRWTQTIEQQQSQLTEALQAGMSHSLEKHVQRLAEAHSQQNQFDTFGTAVREWQTGMTNILSATQNLSQDLQAQGDVLLKLTQQEDGLHGLQTQLNANLQAIRSSGAFEETLHTLNAAVHLLTNRIQSRAA